MTKKYYTKEKLVTPRARSKRLRRLGVSAVNTTFASFSLSGQSSSTEQSSLAMTQKRTSAVSVAKFVTSQGNPTPDVGQCYYEKKLGLPLWWNGDSWVDSTGARLIDCVIGGNELPILEGSSLVVEVPEEVDVAVMMGGEDITEAVLNDCVITIPYVMGNIEIKYNEN